MMQHLIDLMIASQTDHYAGVQLMAELSLGGFAFVTASIMIVTFHEYVNHNRRMQCRKYYKGDLKSLKPLKRVLIAQR